MLHYRMNFMKLMFWSYICTNIGFCAIHPPAISVHEGDSVELRLLPLNVNFTSCTLKVPNATLGHLLASTDYQEPNISDSRIIYVGSEAIGDCRVIITNITINDAGYWRLTSISPGGNRVVGAAFIEVVFQNKSESKGIIRQFPQRKNVLESSAAANCRIPKDQYIKTKNNDSLVAAIGSTITVQCKTATALSDCWIQHPNGSLYNPKSLQNGECAVIVNQAKEADSGVWVCHMNPKRCEGKELLLNVTVKITAAPFRANSSIIKNLGSGPVIVFCHTLSPEMQLKTCKITRPDGKKFEINVTSWKTSHYSYYGDGLNHGHCGLRIEGLRPEDFGIWMCATDLDGYSTEIEDMILISYPDGSLVLLQIGVGMGVLLLLGTIILLLWKHNQSTLQPRPVVRRLESIPEAVETEEPI